MRTSAHFGAKKNFGFFEIYSVSARTRRERRVESVRAFYGQEGTGSNFGRLFWTASKKF